MGRAEHAVVAIVLVSALMATAAAAFEDAVARPVSFTIERVTVAQEGQRRPDPNGHQTPQLCARFHLSGTAGLRWFRQAHEVSRQVWLHELDWMQCSVSGRLRTRDGRTLPWELDQSGRGRVAITSELSAYFAGPELPLRRLASKPASDR